MTQLPIPTWAEAAPILLKAFYVSLPLLFVAGFVLLVVKGGLDRGE